MMSILLFQDIKMEAKRKGLKLQRNSFKSGWSITLPCGTINHAESDLMMMRYVRGY